jgi:hypothetical protein
LNSRQNAAASGPQTFLIQILQTHFSSNQKNLAVEQFFMKFNLQENVPLHTKKSVNGFFFLVEIESLCLMSPGCLVFFLMLPCSLQNFFVKFNSVSFEQCFLSLPANVISHNFSCSLFPQKFQSQVLNYSSFLFLMH